MVNIQRLAMFFLCVFPLVRFSRERWLIISGVENVDELVLLGLAVPFVERHPQMLSTTESPFCDLAFFPQYSLVLR